MKLIHTI